MTRFLRLLGSAIAIALGLHFLNWDQLIASAARIDPAAFLAALGLAVASLGVLGLRWIYIVQRVAPAPAKEQWRIYLLGTFLNSFTPANIGGDVYRVVALRPWSTGHALSGLLAAITVERIFGLCSFFVGYLLSLVLYAATNPPAFSELGAPLIYPAGPITAALIALPLLPRALRWSRKLRLNSGSGAVRRQIRGFRRGLLLATKRNVLVLGLLSFSAWAGWVAAVAVIASRMGLTVPLVLLAAVVSLTELVRLIPVSFQGIGIREGAFSALIGMAGGSPEIGFIVAAVAYAALSIALAVCGVIAWLLGLVSPLLTRLPSPKGEAATAPERR